MEEYDIIGVTESWIDSKYKDFLAEFSIPGYNLYSSERHQRKGGGMLLYVKSTLHPIALLKQAIENINATYIQLKINLRKITIGLIYRPPAQSHSIDDKLYEQLAEISCENQSIIFGDLNLPVNKWGCPLTSHSGHDLYVNLLESSFHQHVEHPTRGNNILDIILSTEQILVNNVTVGCKFSTSDHRVITYNIEMEKPKIIENKKKYQIIEEQTLINLEGL